MAIGLYDHQKKAINDIRSGSILVGGVGSGKSRTAIAYYFIKECGGAIKDGIPKSIKTKKDLYIITTARKRDTLEWEAELVPFLLNKDNDFGINVVIDSWNNIGKYIDSKNSFFIFDEQRVVGYGAWVKSFLKIAKDNRWILLSATPGDVWMDYLPVFIANGFYKNKTEFVRKHVVYSRFSKYPKIERYINTRILEEYRKRVLVMMPCDRDTVRHRHDIRVRYDGYEYSKVQTDCWNVFTDKPIKDASEMCLALRKIVNTSIERLYNISNIYKQHGKIILFYNFDYELEFIKDYLDKMEIIYSEWNGHKHQSIPESDKWIYLVQYTAGAEGWNCTLTDAIIFYSLNYSYKIMEQAAGRIDRLNTKFIDLHYYYFISDSSIDKAIQRALTNKKAFNEKSFVSNLAVNTYPIIERE